MKKLIILFWKILGWFGVRKKINEKALEIIDNKIRAIREINTTRAYLIRKGYSFHGWSNKKKRPIPEKELSPCQAMRKKQRALIEDGLKPTMGTRNKWNIKWILPYVPIEMEFGDGKKWRI